MSKAETILTYMTLEEEMKLMLRQRDKERQEKIDKGEITCNIDEPDDCESCSG